MKIEDEVTGPNGERYSVLTTEIGMEYKEDCLVDDLIPAEYETVVYKVDKEGEIICKDDACSPFLQFKYYTEGEAKIVHQAIRRRLQKYGLVELE